MITHQLQQRVVQEAELLFARVRSGALDDGSMHGLTATISEIDTGKARIFNKELAYVPQYCMNRLMPDEVLRAELWNWMQCTRLKGHGWTNNNGIIGLQQHRHTTAMAIALWRLATWVDSMISTHVS